MEKTQKITGTVDKSKIKTHMSNKTNKPFHAAIIGGIEFTFFDDALKEGLIQFDGRKVECEYRKNGNYNNLISAEPVFEETNEDANIPKERTTSSKEKMFAAEAASQRAVEQAIENRKPQNADFARINSMCLSYAKDLVVAGKIELKEMYSEARKMKIFVETGESYLDFKKASA